MAGRQARRIAGQSPAGCPFAGSVAGGCNTVRFAVVAGWAQARSGPQPAGDLQRIDDAVAGPPGPLVAGAMQGVMMDGAQRHRELVRDLERQRPRLGKAQVVGLRRPAAAHQAWLPGDELQMLLAADPLLLGQGKRRFAVTRRNGPIDVRGVVQPAKGARPRLERGDDAGDRIMVWAVGPRPKLGQAFEIGCPERVERVDRRQRRHQLQDGIDEGRGPDQALLAAIATDENEFRRPSKLRGRGRGRDRLWLRARHRLRA